MKTRINPIAREVKEVFDGVFAMTQNFATNPNSAINGLIVSGDAGIGKTHTVKQALKAAGVQKNVEYIKGGKITAASLYVKLYLNRAKHRIVVLDDCDIIHHQDKRQIIPMLLGATELGQKGEVSWEVARKNALMEEYDVPTRYDFEGSIIWITNDTVEDISRAAKQWKQAIFSRFNTAKCYFTDEQKYMYTMHLCEHLDMLGSNCQEFPGGYSDAAIDGAMDYMADNYRQLVEVTPRQAIKIADIIEHTPDPALRKMQLNQLWK